MAMDMELHVPSDPTATWSLDIEVVNGQPVLVDPINTPRQRAAVAAYMGLGTVPGNEGIGVDWGGYVSQRLSLVDIDNQVKRSMQEMVGEPTISSQLMPLYEENEDGGLGLRLWDINQQKGQAT